MRVARHRAMFSEKYFLCAELCNFHEQHTYMHTLTAHHLKKNFISVMRQKRTEKKTQAATSSEHIFVYIDYSFDDHHPVFSNNFFLYIFSVHLLFAINVPSLNVSL